ncbi:hypothetical protein MMC24_002592 [Lignoscripta atroalba]|nr:hypothetical protein [Lignoscripta atroalba]
METTEVTCQIRVRTTTSLSTLRECPKIPTAIRQKWVRQLSKEFQLQPNKTKQAIRPWDLILNEDGTVESCAEPFAPKEGHGYVYPAHFRIPPCTIEDLLPDDQVKRAELFAFGSVLYHIYTGKKPFEEVDSDDDDDQVQSRFLNADTPPDLTSVPSWPIILSCWSLEFAKELSNRPQPPNPLVRYIKSHPYLFALQSTGLAVTTVALGAPLILGAAGFGALGPVAGSAAVAWQSSMGIVQAGSVFAWCQSAAMGGAAAGGIMAAGAVGAGGAAGATLMGWALGEEERERLLEVYRRVFRRGPGAVGDRGGGERRARSLE